METLARYFDMPLDSREHRMLAEEAWMGGRSVAVRYYLGRQIGRNLFRESNADVEARLVDHFSRATSTEGGRLIGLDTGWLVAADILRYRFEMQTKGESALKARNIAAVEAFLAEPSISIDSLARKLSTTTKQLQRISNLTWLRRLHEMGR